MRLKNAVAILAVVAMAGTALGTTVDVLDFYSTAASTGIAGSPGPSGPNDVGPAGFGTPLFNTYSAAGTWTTVYPAGFNAGAAWMQLALLDGPGGAASVSLASLVPGGALDYSQDVTLSCDITVDNSLNDTTLGGVGVHAWGAEELGGQEVWNGFDVGAFQTVSQTATMFIPGGAADGSELLTIFLGNYHIGAFASDSTITYSNFTITYTTPEPATALLLGLPLLLVRRRR